ncbi:MAG: response regulator transcription factor [Chloroflexi bacterium]|nr:response regulator transcription factor [Chloroflexota bacterium]MDA1283037.1 response regulator transcription factor [Chloroflexota bacterium]
MKKPKVLIIEDNRSLREALRYNLAADGYEPEVASDGAAGLKAIRSFRPDIVILDVMLPKISGLEVCEALTRSGSLLPIIMLTAMGTEEDRVIGLQAGAIDYLTKPFSIKELMARVAAQIRRSDLNQTAGGPVEIEQLKFQHLSINLDSRTISVCGERVNLNLREFDLLNFMASNPGRVFTRVQLLEQVWDRGFVGNTRTVDVHVRWLRKKIEKNPAKPTILHTVRGVGYRFNT